MLLELNDPESSFIEETLRRYGTAAAFALAARIERARNEHLAKLATAPIDGSGAVSVAEQNIGRCTDCGHGLGGHYLICSESPTRSAARAVAPLVAAANAAGRPSSGQHDSGDQ